METEGNRRFRRLRASIPCLVSWEEEVFPAEVTNLSHGGALITGAGRIPDVGAQLVVVLQVGQEDIRFRTQARQITENDQPDSFGIEFSETRQEIESKLIRLMEVLYPNDEELGSED
jgi:hypothetical protein